MTIRSQHLTISPSDDTYLRAPQDGTNALALLTPSVRDRLLGFVRHIMRDERCDIVPVVLSATIHPTNEFGHNMQVEVRYARRGYRAIFAGLAEPDSLTNVQCYMD